MKYFIVIALAGMVVYVACDFHSPVDFGLGIQQSAAKRMADSEACFLVQWDCDHAAWETKADSTFSIFYKNVRLTTNSTGPPTITEYLDGSSKRVYESGAYARYDRHRAIFRFVDGQCGMWSTAFDDTTAKARIFHGEIEWRYRNLPAHSEYVVVEDGVKHRIARVNPDTSLNYTDYWGLYYRNSRPSSLAGRYYLPVNFSAQAPSTLPYDDTALIVNSFLGCLQEIDVAAAISSSTSSTSTNTSSTSSAPYKGMIDAINEAVDESNAQQDCIDNGGTWNGFSCTYPVIDTGNDDYNGTIPNVSEVCENAGGRWHEDRCLQDLLGLTQSECDAKNGRYEKDVCAYYLRSTNADLPDCPSDCDDDYEDDDDTREGVTTHTRRCEDWVCKAPIVISIPKPGTQAGDCVLTGGTWDGSTCECPVNRLGGVSGWRSINVQFTNGSSETRWACCGKHPLAEQGINCSTCDYDRDLNLCAIGSADGDCTISPGESYTVVCSQNICPESNPDGSCKDPVQTRCECGYNYDHVNGGCVRDPNLTACSSDECTSGGGIWKVATSKCECPGAGRSWRNGACRCSNTREGGNQDDDIITYKEYEYSDSCGECIVARQRTCELTDAFNGVESNCTSWEDVDPPTCHTN